MESSLFQFASPPYCSGRDGAEMINLSAAWLVREARIGSSNGREEGPGPGRAAGGEQAPGGGVCLNGSTRECVGIVSGNLQSTAARGNTRAGHPP